MVASKPASLSFLAHPSRIPVGQREGIIGVAFVFDKWHNLVRKPEDVDFRLAVKDGPAATQTVRSRDGVAWIQMNSARKAGNARFVAALDGIEEARVMQQVASEPCHLQIRAARNAKGVLVPTALWWKPSRCAIAAAIQFLTGPWLPSPPTVPRA